MARKSIFQTNRRRFEAAVAAFGSLLPEGWGIATVRRSTTGGVIRVDAPDGSGEEIVLIVRDRLTPRDAVAQREPDGPTIIAAGWLSPRTREVLDDNGIGYVDETGNVFVALSRPGLLLRTQGARRDPSPKPTKGPNLRGPRAWALLRTLGEVQPPYGVGRLAAAIGADQGYVSRLLSALTEELLISRAPRGPVQQVEWEAVLRQLSTSYSLLGGNEITSWIASSGAEQFLRDLADGTVKDWAITGSFAAEPLVSVAAPEIAVVYVEDPERLATTTRLRQVRNGGNVFLARPYDRIVFRRTWSRDGARYVSPAQIVVDCLTGPGRMPSEGEALLGWLRRKAPRWQATDLSEEADLP